MFLRVSIPGDDPSADGLMAEVEDYLATIPDPVYGAQLQDFATAGLKAEYRMDVTYTEEEVVLSDGEIVGLRRPAYRAADLCYGPLHPDAMLSPRVAPQKIGLGLLEAIPAADILAMADPEDADGDGISGRPNIVPSVEFGQPMPGRFGLKAGSATVREQSAAAFSGDIGISTPLFVAMRGYAGSVVFSGDGAGIAISSPRGGRVHRFSPYGAFLGSVYRADVCGLAPQGGGYLASDGMGGLVEIGPDRLTALSRHDCAWDNHIVTL